MNAPSSSPSAPRNLDSADARTRGGAALLTAAGIGLGAFGAHALKSSLAESGRLADLEIWQTAVFYHLIHTVFLAAAGARCPKLARMLMLAGVIGFSGSLYLLVLSNMRWLGAVTPFGGSLLIAAWVVMAVAWLRGR